MISVMPLFLNIFIVELCKIATDVNTEAHQFCCKLTGRNGGFEENEALIVQSSFSTQKTYSVTAKAGSSDAKITDD